jgi:hypothetical protein
MRRSARLVSLVIVVLLGVAVLGPRPNTRAQGGTPAAFADHPIVGEWVSAPLGTRDATDHPETPRVLLVFHEDGSFKELYANKAADFGGVWRATGPETVELTAVTYIRDASDAFAGSLLIHGDLDVDEAGDALTGSATLSYIAPDGSDTVAWGPDPVSATRMAAEAMGTPVATPTS